MGRAAGICWALLLIASCSSGSEDTATGRVSETEGEDAATGPVSSSGDVATEAISSSAGVTTRAITRTEGAGFEGMTTETVSTSEGLAAARALWVEARSDGYQVAYAGLVGGEREGQRLTVDLAIAEVAEPIDRNRIDLGVEGLYDRLTAAADLGATFALRFNTIDGLPLEVQITDAQSADVEVELVDYRPLTRDVGCAADPGSPTDLKSEPIRYSGLVGVADPRFETADGCPLRRDVMSMRNGPKHCDWDQVRFLSVAADLGELSPGLYMFDAEDWLGRYDNVDRSKRLVVAELASTAENTGFRLDGAQLWSDPATPQYLYLVVDGLASQFVRGGALGPVCA